MMQAERAPYEAERLPRLWIDWPFEGSPRLQLICDSHEDELALRSWLRQCACLDHVQREIDRLLNDLDDVDARKAA